MILAMLVVASTVMAIGISLAITSSETASGSAKNKEAILSYGLAETCLEDNLLRMSRGEMTPAGFTTDVGSCTIELSGSAPNYILSITGKVDQAVRKINATVSIENEVLNIQEIKESY